MKSRKLTVGSLKTQPKKLPDHKLVEETIRYQQEAKPRKQATKKIEVMQNNNLYTIIPSQRKTSLLDLALEQNQLLSYKCKKGSCGKCTVKVLSGAPCLGEVTKQEQKKLKNHVDLDYRLSCQAVVGCK
ncbi:2Fe-2S iron-sulfur cluster-binding protein [Halalkalibacter lacteus]|uniref:2Fe-2S iron-sulfur cluster-binding protein n=1 Tax=Halalkalibacter lacteus TaxID=3090663 RepID=UPI002FCAFC37